MMKNIFLEKSYTKYGDKLIPRNFSKKWKLRSGLVFWSFIYFIPVVCEVEDYRKWLKLSCRPFAFTTHKAFFKNKNRSGTSLTASFSAWFLKKNIFFVILYYLTKFQFLVTFTSRDIGQYEYCNCLLIKSWRQKFWN